ncbi:Hypothetical predicted protein, partial [Pelobates cultripes]
PAAGEDSGLMAFDEFQIILDTTTATYINKALASTMRAMSSSITQALAKALLQPQGAQPVPFTTMAAGAMACK